MSCPLGPGSDFVSTVFRPKGLRARGPRSPHGSDRPRANRFAQSTTFPTSLLLRLLSKDRLHYNRSTTTTFTQEGACGAHLRPCLGHFVSRFPFAPRLAALRHRHGGTNS